MREYLRSVAIARGSLLEQPQHFCVTINCASGMPQRFSPSCLDDGLFPINRDMKVPSVRLPMRHVIFATEIRTANRVVAALQGRPFQNGIASASGMDYRRGAALETIYRYDISHAVLSLCTQYYAILYNLPGG